MNENVTDQLQRIAVHLQGITEQQTRHTKMKRSETAVFDVDF
jgi:hypothetical protein